MRSRFIGGREGADHLQSLSSYPFDKFKHTQIVKIWPGQYFAVYRFDEASLNPIIICKLKIMNVDADENGLRIQILDCKTTDLYNVRHVPVLAAGYEIGVAAPHRAYIERTVKEVSHDDDTSQFYYGVATGMLVIHREDPDSDANDIDCLMDWYKLKDKFTDDRAYYDEVDRYERGGK